MRVLVSAAETSSDIHGAQILKELKQRYPNLEAFGLGGPQLRAAGLDVVIDAKDLLAMGFSEILTRLPKIVEALGLLEQTAAERRPDVAIVIDYPDFHFRLARRLRDLQIPVIYFIPPKVWVWRKHRIHELRRLFARLLCIFPFEEAFYRREGVLAKFVGNPLVEELPLSMSREEARRRLGVTAEELVLALLPGSRPAELKNHVKLFAESARSACLKLRKIGRLKPNQRLRVLMPLPETADPSHWRELLEAAFAQSSEVDLKVSVGDSHLALVAADAAVVKSGTSTLEAALLRCPHSVVYKTSATTAWIFKHLIRYRGPISLPNLVWGWRDGRCDAGCERVVPELVCEQASLENIAEWSATLLTGGETADRMKGIFSELRKLFEQGGHQPSKRVVDEIEEFLASRDRVGAKGGGMEEPIENGIIKSPQSSKLVLRGASWLWSEVNRGAREAKRRGWLKSVKLGVRTISVGNLQVGGAGKTPLVALIAREAQERGKNVAVLCRGYGGEWENCGGVLKPGDMATARVCGDEAALLHDLAPAAWIGIGADRVASFERMSESQKFDLVILDDGFQHWKIDRDLDILAVTGAVPGEVLFRDSFRAACHAGLLVWTKGKQLPALFGELRLPLTRVRFQIRANAVGGNHWLVTGVAQGAHVRSTAEDAGFRFSRHIELSDHVRYTSTMVESLLGEAQAAAARIVLTGKDWVKWRDLGVARDQVTVLEPEIEFEEGREVWNRTIWGE